MDNHTPDIHDAIFDVEKYPQRYVLYTGGRGSGKSHDIAEDVTLLTYVDGVNILFARYYATSVMTSIAPAFLNAAERLGVREDFRVTKDRIVNTTTGNYILLKGLHQPGGASSGLKSLEGISHVFIEEGEDLDSEKAWEIFNKLDDSVRRNDIINKVVLILNPKSREGEVYKNFIKESNKKVLFNGFPMEISTRRDVIHIHCTFDRVRQYLSDGWLKKEARWRHKAEKGTDPDSGRKLSEKEWEIAKDFYANNYIGCFADFIEGLVFGYYEKTDVFPENMKYVYGMDFGWAHENTLVKVGVDLKARKIYVQELLAESNLPTSELAKKITKYCDYGIEIIADSASPRTINDLIMATNKPIKPVKKPDVGQSINRMLDFTIVVCGENQLFETELKTYRWSEKLNTKGYKVPNKADDADNVIDAVRYALTVLLQDYDKVTEQLGVKAEKTVRQLKRDEIARKLAKLKGNK